MTVRALIDGHMLDTGETGNETYIRGLLGGLERLGLPQLVAIPHPFVDVGVHEPVVLPHRSDAARIFLDLTSAAWDHGADLIHSTYAIPPLTPLTRVVTVHDVSFLRHPEWFTVRDRAVLNAGVRYSVRYASRVLVPSEHARSEVEELLRVPAHRLVVTPEGVGPEFAPPPDDVAAAALDRVRVREPYVLALGNLQPRKNLARLIVAWGLLAEAEQTAGCHLVIAGGHRGRREPLKELIASLGLTGKVTLSGYVGKAELPALYSRARAFVFPTLYEGFGLPVLEAMACGTPVACSRDTSLPEVAGDAAVYFDPSDTADIAAVLGALITDGELRDRLSDRGTKRAADSTWEACAQTTLRAYEEAVLERRS